MNAEFAVHRLNRDGVVKAENIAMAFDVLMQALEIYCPAGRHFSIVRTKLEEACFFAKKAMACAEENQEKETV